MAERLRHRARRCPIVRGCDTTRSRSSSTPSAGSRRTTSPGTLQRGRGGRLSGGRARGIARRPRRASWPRLLDEAGLRVVAAHEGIEAPARRRDGRRGSAGRGRVPAGDRAVDARGGSADGGRRPSLRRRARRVRHGASRSSGIRLGYHNHAFEFAPLDGTTVWDILLAELPPEVEIELDVYWAAFGGRDPVAEIRRHGRPRAAAPHEGPRARSGAARRPGGGGDAAVPGDRRGGPSRAASSGTSPSRTSRATRWSTSPARIGTCDRSPANEDRAVSTVHPTPLDGGRPPEAAAAPSNGQRSNCHGRDSSRTPRHSTPPACRTSLACAGKSRRA